VWFGKGRLGRQGRMLDRGGLDWFGTGGLGHDGCLGVATASGLVVMMLVMVVLPGEGGKGGKALAVARLSPQVCVGVCVGVMCHGEYNNSLAVRDAVRVAMAS
jgi:hypothetical protein